MAKSKDESRAPLINEKAGDSKPFQVSPVPPWYVFINPFSWLLWILDFLIWLLSILLPIRTIVWCCRRATRPYSFAEDDEDEAPRRRRAELWEDGLMTSPFENGHEEGGTTAWDIFVYAGEEHADKHYLGTRKYLGTHMPEGGRFPLKKFGETEWQTYSEAVERMRYFGAGLRQLGVMPIPLGMDLQRTSAPHNILLFEETCADWITALGGAFSQSIAVATSYATLGMAAVGDALTEGNVTVCVCNQNNVSKLAESAPACLRHIVYTHNYVEDEKRGQKPASAKDIKVWSMDEVVELGRQSNLKPTPPEPETMAVIMYTSGSTGKPKGVMLSHKNISAAVAGLTDALDISVGVEVYIAYLPAAHILELCAEMTLTFNGGALGFADPKTITSKGAVRERPDGTLNELPGGEYPPGAIQEFKPTLMAAVPIVWDVLKKGAEEAIGQKGAIVKWLFQVVYAAQYAATKSGRTCPLFNCMPPFSTFRGMLGGRMKLGVTGGGPVSADIQSFIRTAFGFNLIQGYALTETCSAGCVQDGFDPDDSVVGGPVSSVEVMLRSCDAEGDPPDRDGNPYLASDTHHFTGEACQGRGEVLIRGAPVSLGYYKQPEKTAEAFIEDGWFRTGDVGLWDRRGRLRLVDRLKNLVKLMGGEYIAIENMEKEYNASGYVQGLNGGIMCIGDGEMRKPAAIVQANMAEIRKWARSEGISTEDDEALCNDGAIRAMVLKDLVSRAKGKLGGNELIGAVHLVPGTGPPDAATVTSPWTPENGCQTASKKLDRRNAAAIFKTIIETDLKPKCS